MRRTAALQLGWLATQARAARRFQAAMLDPERAQAARLTELVSALGPSAYGREVGLDRVQSFADLQRVPIVDYDALEPWVARIAAGETGVSSTEPVEVLEPTGGTTGGTKLIPTTARLRAEFAEAVGAWMVDLHRSLPRLLGTRSYWSISRAVRTRRATEGGVPIGFDDDASYFGPLERWAIRRLMAVPGDVAQSASLDAWREATALYLIEAWDLGLISVWSPTFLTILMDWIAANRTGLLPKLSPAARERLACAWDGRIVHGAMLWPRLQVVSAWGDGFAEGHLPALLERFQGVRFQAKGLLATEGVVSFPLVGEEGHVLAVTAHVLELQDLSDGTVIRPHEARLDGEYRPILTTGGGFVRYALPDAVRVVGFSGRIPRIRLSGRLDRGSDRVGEKLTEGFVARALAGLWERPPGFAMLCPVDGPRYALVVDAAPPTAEAVDRALGEAYHYRYARELGQLGEPVVCVVLDAWARWERAIEGLGLGLGDQKPGALEVRATVVGALVRGGV